MDSQGPQSFWTDIVGQRLAMETNSARNPRAILSGLPDDPTQTVSPAPHPRQSDSLLDGEKTGATLLFSGVILALVGITFTNLGWKHYQASSDFVWTQLLGPILISVGGTFVLTSVCKFGVMSWWSCRHWGKEVPVRPEMEQTSRAPFFTISALSQPIMLNSTTTMLPTPPAYDGITQEVRRASDFLHVSFVDGVHVALPAHDGVNCVGNAAFTSEEEDSPTSCTETYQRRRTEKTEDESGCADESDATCSSPPAYEDLYPYFNKHSLS
ncbi:transmembrane protein 174 [Mastacembelus armatus]|uniref:Transmembrane protein 174 n=1 Tax=Mastacembelus armatus TaxID=205130 RepID=A0A3Q3KW66_9TELE|nr:transmembrane protein 174 [Mastacembelus armatus]